MVNILALCYTYLSRFSEVSTPPSFRALRHVARVTARAPHVRIIPTLVLLVISRVKHSPFVDILFI